jgi:hypothetical protein
MVDRPTKIMGGGCLGGLIGAFLGVVIGGFIGKVYYGSPHPVDVPHPIEVRGGARDWREGARELEMELAVGALGTLDVCGAFFIMVLGAGIGGIIGGVGGSVLGAGVAAKASRTLTKEPPSVEASRSANGSEPPTESPDAELARLKQRVTELEAKKRSDDRFKER